MYVYMCIYIIIIIYQISPTCFGAYCTILLSLDQNCLLIVMLLHQLQSIKYITCWFYNVIYNY